MSLIKYKTIGGNEVYEAEYTIQKSRFISHVRHVETEDEAKTFLLQIKKKYFDATHNCSAWVIGVLGDKQKSNDDGEPGGTAGNPILETIKKNGLTNTMVIVTRYFGGIKLGAGGLIRAYSHSAALGLSSSQIVTMMPMQRIKFTVNYNLLNIVENWIRQKKIHIDNTEYADNVTFTILVEPNESDERLTDLTNLTAANFSYEVEGESYMTVKDY
ncbi:MAG: YigZ family protein [Selenomonadaceae bacterium]|nr:YigZ family protein [Selenomonadaceae bacterium]